LVDRGHPAFGPQAYPSQVYPNGFNPYSFEKIVPYNVERNFGIEVDKYYSKPSYETFTVDVEKFIAYPIEKTGHYDLEGPFAAYAPELYYSPHVNPFAYSVEDDQGFYPEFAYKSHPHVFHL
jgi:hypothetical protein